MEASTLPRKGNRWDSEHSKHGWSEVAAQVAATPGEWVFAGSDVASGTVQNVRNGRIAALRGLGGHLEASVRHSRIVGTTRYGHLYLRWTPDGWSERVVD